MGIRFKLPGSRCRCRGVMKRKSVPSHSCSRDNLSCQVLNIFIPNHTRKCSLISSKNMNSPHLTPRFDKLNVQQPTLHALLTILWKHRPLSPPSSSPTRPPCRAVDTPLFLPRILQEHRRLSPSHPKPTSRAADNHSPAINPPHSLPAILKKREPPTPPHPSPDFSA